MEGDALFSHGVSGDAKAQGRKGGKGFCIAVALRLSVFASNQGGEELFMIGVGLVSPFSILHSVLVLRGG